MAIFAAIGLGINLLGAISGRKKEKKAARNRAAITRLQNKQSRREFMKTLRQSIATGRVTSLQATGGSFESSLGFGGMSSRKTQGETITKEFDEMNRLGVAAAKQQQQAEDFKFAGKAAASVGSLIDTVRDLGE